MQYLPWRCHRWGGGFSVLTDPGSKLLFVHEMINTTRHCLFFYRGWEDSRNRKLIGSLLTEKMINTVWRPCSGAQRCCLWRVWDTDTSTHRPPWEWVPWRRHQAQIRGAMEKPGTNLATPQATTHTSSSPPPETEDWPQGMSGRGGSSHKRTA
jgi:hypothetical protein